MSVLKSYFSYLEDEDLIAKSPMRKMKARFKIRQKIPVTLTIEEVKMMLKAPVEEKKNIQNNGSRNNIRIAGIKRCIRNKAILEFLFATGIRVGELVGLNIDDLDMKEYKVKVLGKGNKERLIYFFSRKTLKALREYLKIRGKINAQSEALFLNRFNMRLSATSIEKIFRKSQITAQINRKVTPHCFRHTMASLLINNGVDIRLIQEILGHASISTTQIYTKVSVAKQMEVLRSINPRDIVN
jgi:site-specific recombinase XerD